MDRDPRQPGGESGASGKLVEVLISPDVSILHNIFRLGIIVQNRARDPVDQLKASDKKDHPRVDVNGDVQGDTLKVTSVKLQ